MVDSNKFTLLKDLVN